MTKIPVVVDAQGLPIRLGLTAGQAHDGQIADTLLDHLGPRTIALTEKACDADRIRDLIQDQGATPNIPPNSNRKWKRCFRISELLPVSWTPKLGVLGTGGWRCNDGSSAVILSSRR